MLDVMSQIVESYGLHWQGSVAWLIQGRGGTNFVGLNAQAPFRAKGGECNHLIPAAAPIPDRVHWEGWQRISKDPLARMMLPLPRRVDERAAFFPGDGSLDLYLATLSRLSSPINPIVKPAWLVTTKDLDRELSMSNIQPLVITGVKTRDQPLVDRIGQLVAFKPRPVVLVGDPDVVVSPPMRRFRTGLADVPLTDLMALPFENIGATILRRYSRKEDIDAPLESRDQRRERILREREKGSRS